MTEIPTAFLPSRPSPGVAGLLFGIFGAVIGVMSLAVVLLLRAGFDSHVLDPDLGLILAVVAAPIFVAAPALGALLALVALVIGALKGRATPVALGATGLLLAFSYVLAMRATGLDHVVFALYLSSR